MTRTKEKKTGMETLPKWLWAAAALSALLILGLGSWFYKAQRDYLVQRAEQDLEAIARLKVDQLVQWRAERLGDASVLMANALLAEAYSRLLADPQAGNAEPLLALFRSLQTHYGYADIMLVDAGGQVRLSLSGNLAALDAVGASAVAEAFRDRRALFSPLHATDDHPAPHIGAVAPFFAGNGSNAASLGAVLLWTDASHFLYPLIQSWPMSSASAETLLVRRDGDSVLYLNELRHQSNTALKLRIPLSRTNLPAAMAVQGKLGVLHGLDYRGVEVLSVLKAVPDSSWFIVAKMDSREAFSAWRVRSVMILALLLVLLALIGAAVLAGWQSSQKEHYLALFRAEAGLRREAERYEELNRTLEQRVQERTAELRAANEELESFCYSVSHDLRAPLRHVNGYVGMLEREAGDQLSGKAQRFLKTITEASTQMSALIDDLLAFSRMNRGKMLEETVDLNELAREVLKTLEETTPSRTILWKIPSLPPVQGDRKMLKQVLANLLGNALKYTGPRDAPEVEMGCAGEENGRAIVFVRDNGVGFDPRYAHKLFGVFQRLHRADEFEGTGIGLATVRRIIARHGGRTWAEGAVNGGATFYFTLQPDERRV